MEATTTEAARYAGLYVENLVDMADRLKAKIDRLNEGDDGELARRWLRDHAESVRTYAGITRSMLLDHCPPDVSIDFVEYAESLAEYAESLIGWLDACNRPTWDKGRPAAIQGALSAIHGARHRLNDTILGAVVATGQESAQTVGEHKRLCEEMAGRPELLEQFRQTVAPQMARLKQAAAKWSGLVGPLF